jgi:hypothetical protein
VVLSSVTALRAHFLSLAPTQGVELWRFAGDEGRRIAREEHATGELAELWFAHIAAETAHDVHHSVAITREGAARDWLVVAAPRAVAAERLAMFPGAPRQRVPDALSPATMRAVGDVSTALGRRARARSKGKP